jgi:hypothetical protein
MSWVNRHLAGLAALLRALLNPPACPACGHDRSCPDCLAWQAHK